MYRPAGPTSVTVPPLVDGRLGYEYAIPLTTSRASRVTTSLREHNAAQRAPSARPGFDDVSREGAQTSSALITKRRRFSSRFAPGDGPENRRLRQCNISICEVLISVTLSGCGEVAERLKAAVC